MKQEKKFNTYHMTLVAVMAAIICIISPFSINIPVSPVPISLSNLAICISAGILGWKLGTGSVLIFLLLGAAGLPVFSNFSGGLVKLAGPTGGYLIGDIFLALIVGYFFDKFKNPAICFIGLVLGTIVLYIFGTAWLCFQANLTFSQGLAAGVIPFIPADLAKLVITILLVPILRKRLAGAGLLYSTI